MLCGADVEVLSINLGDLTWDCCLRLHEEGCVSALGNPQIHTDIHHRERSQHVERIPNMSPHHLSGSDTAMEFHVFVLFRFEMHNLVSPSLSLSLLHTHTHSDL